VHPPLATQPPVPPADPGINRQRATQPPIPTPRETPPAAKPSIRASGCTHVHPTAAPDMQPVVYAPLLEEIQAVGATTSPEQVRRLASRLAAALYDPGSLGCYISVLAKAVAGTVALPCLIAAYKAGLGAVDKAQRPGAIFMFTLRNFTPPPLPSQIRYYQQRSTETGAPVQCMAAGGATGVAGSALTGALGTGTHAPEPAETAETLRDLRAMAGDQRHPLRHVARRRLGEIAADSGHQLQDVARRLVEGL
jgi:hypothetical protein